MSGMRALGAALASGVALVVLGAAPAHAWHGFGLITAVAIDAASTVYAGTADRGLFKSTDGGTTWTHAGLTGLVDVLAVDPLTPGTLYVGVSNGVLKSTDGGATWSATGPAGVSVTALAVDPVTPTTLYAGSHNVVYASADGGATWSGGSALEFAGGMVLALAVDPVTPTTIFAGKDLNYNAFDPELYGGGVFKSTDGGATWGAVGLSGMPISRVVIDPETPTTLYASMLSGWGVGVFKSTDGGATWGSAAGSMRFNALAIDPETPTTLYAGTHFGVAKSTDGGATWVAANSGLTDTLLPSGSVRRSGPWRSTR